MSVTAYMVSLYSQLSLLARKKLRLSGGVSYNVFGEKVARPEGVLGSCPRVRVYFGGGVWMNPLFEKPG